MNSRPAKIESFPAGLLTGALMFTAVALLGTIWSAIGSYRDALGHKRQMRVQELLGSIVHLDEVLTMSARMSASTGEPRWEERYRDFETQLDAFVKEAITLSPQSLRGRAAAQTDQANQKLVAMENRAFDLVRAGQSESARAILFGDDYERQKRLYAEGMLELLHDLRAHLDAAEQRNREHGFLSVLLALVPIVLLTVAWFRVRRRLAEWRASLARTIGALARAENSLQAANENLEQRVQERTRALKNEVAERQRVEEALRNAEEKYRRIFEQSVEGIFQTTEEGRYLVANPTLAEIYGFDSAAELQANVTDIGY